MYARVCALEMRRQRACARERERESERGKFIDNQIDDWRSVSTTPLQGDTAAGHSWPSIGGEYYTRERESEEERHVRETRV